MDRGWREQQLSLVSRAGCGGVKRMTGGRVYSAGGWEGEADGRVEAASCRNKQRATRFILTKGHVGSPAAVAFARRETN